MSSADARLSSRSYRRLRLAVLDRDLGLCQMKGPTCTRFATEVDHIVARADGGAMWDPTNLRAACGPCNSRGGAMMTNSRRWGCDRTGPDYVSRF